MMNIEYCEVCKGTGGVVGEFGEPAECNCVIRANFQSKNRKSVVAQVDKATKIIETYKGSYEDEVIIGLIPERRSDDEFDVEYLMNRQESWAKARRSYVVGFDNFKNTLIHILNTFRVGGKLHKSYYLGSPTSFGKATFAHTCIKLLHRQGREVVPYISCAELYDMLVSAQLAGRVAGVLDNLEKFRMELQHIRGLAEPQAYRVYDNISNYIETGVKEISKFPTGATAHNLSRWGWDEYCTAEVVFLSLVGLGMFASYELAALIQLLKIRGSKGLPTIVCTDSSMKWYRDADREYSREFFHSHLVRYEDEDGYAGTKRLHRVSCYFEADKYMGSSSHN